MSPHSVRALRTLGKWIRGSETPAASSKAKQRRAERAATCALPEGTKGLLGLCPCGATVLCLAAGEDCLDFLFSGVQANILGGSHDSTWGSTMGPRCRILRREGHPRGAPSSLPSGVLGLLDPLTFHLRQFQNFRPLRGPPGLGHMVTSMGDEPLPPLKTKSISGLC